MMFAALLAAALVSPADLKARPAAYVDREVTVVDRCAPIVPDLVVLEDRTRTIGGLKLVGANLPVYVEEGVGLQLAAIRAGKSCRVRAEGVLRRAERETEETNALALLGARKVSYYLSTHSVDLYATRCPPGAADVFAPAAEYKKVYHPLQLTGGEPGEFEMPVDSGALGAEDFEIWKATVKGKRVAALCTRFVPGPERPALMLALFDTPENRAVLEKVKAGGRLVVRGRGYGTSPLDPAVFFAAVAVEAK